MKKCVEAMNQFTTANGYMIPAEPTAELEPSVVALRLHLMLEELGEISRALNEKDINHLADGLADLLYVTIGTAVQAGLGPIIEELFFEVHRANMSKDLGARWPGDRGARKGKNYLPPNVAGLVSDYVNSLRKPMMGMSTEFCDVRYGSLSRVFCKLPAGHAGLHVNVEMGMTWK